MSCLKIGLVAIEDLGWLTPEFVDVDQVGEMIVELLTFTSCHSSNANFGDSKTNVIAAT
jgi:hypothetical protein